MARRRPVKMQPRPDCANVLVQAVRATTAGGKDEWSAMRESEANIIEAVGTTILDDPQLLFKLQSNTIIVTRHGEFGVLAIDFCDAQRIVEHDKWGSRYYAPDNDTQSFIELEYQRVTVAGMVIHNWAYATSVTSEPIYKPGEMKHIEDIADSEDKDQPSYFAALGQEVEEAEIKHIKRGDQYACYCVLTNDSEMNPRD